MKITDVRTFLAHPGKGKNLCFVKVDTDAGIHGWGECYTQADRDQQIVAHVQQLTRYLVGRSPMHIKHFMQVAYDDWAGRRGAMDLYSALSGIEQALWDIVGKQLGAPVYTLLGGACRDKIRVYANGWYDGAKTPDALAEKAYEVIERGFTALKFDPVPGPWRTYVSKDVERQAVRNVQAVREAVGPDVDPERGWNAARRAFVQAYGSDTLDASNLIMPLVFFVSPTDPRMLATLDATMRELVSDSLVYRYNVEHTLDGLLGKEGTFSMCTFWLVEALTRARRVDEARLIFEKMLGYANHLGLYAEEIGPSGEALGNFPQAFTHLSLISAAYNLDLALGSRG